MALIPKTGLLIRNLPTLNTSTMSGQYSFDETISPPERVLNACQTPGDGQCTHQLLVVPEAPTGTPDSGSLGQLFIDSLIKRTEPSPNRALRPPGCRLANEKIWLDTAATAMRLRAFGG